MDILGGGLFLPLQKTRGKQRSIQEGVQRYGARGIGVDSGVEKERLMITNAGHYFARENRAQLRGGAQAREKGKGVDFGGRDEKE